MIFQCEIRELTWKDSNGGRERSHGRGIDRLDPKDGADTVGEGWRIQLDWQKA
jgi:hypothetical protein